jgi:steroid delta-isomerase-like uncharacterized protein
MLLNNLRNLTSEAIALAVFALVGFQGSIVSAEASAQEERQVDDNDNSAVAGHDGYTVAPVPRPHTLAFRLAQNYADAWNSHDPDFVVTFFTDDVFYGDITNYVSVNNKEELRAFAAQVFTAIPDTRIDIVGAAANGRFGFIEWIFSGTNPRTGNHFSVQGVSPVEIRGHLISRLIDYWDKATLYRQVGLLPPGL